MLQKLYKPICLYISVSLNAASCQTADSTVSVWKSKELESKGLKTALLYPSAGSAQQTKKLKKSQYRVWNQYSNMTNLTR